MRKNAPTNRAIELCRKTLAHQRPKRFPVEAMARTIHPDDGTTAGSVVLMLAGAPTLHGCRKIRIVFVSRLHTSISTSADSAVYPYSRR